MFKCTEFKFTREVLFPARFQILGLLRIFWTRDEQFQWDCSDELDLAALPVILFRFDCVTLLALLRLPGCLCDRLITTKCQSEEKVAPMETSGETGPKDTGTGPALMLSVNP